MTLEPPMTMRRVLLVEDEVMVAMYIEDVLAELGYQVVAVATSLTRALAFADERNFDFAVLDINLGTEQSFPVADVLRQRGIPFLFVSGYTSGGLADGYRNEVRIRKPFRTHDLANAIGRLPA
jgi:CheY-like chemotaxis protein